MKKFLKVALVTCACALIAVPFAGCDFGGKNEFKVTEEKWAAALSADKYAFSSASSNPSSSSLTIYVDGSLAKQIATSQSGTTTTYFQQNGDSSHFYNLNTSTNKWERNTAPMPFESLTFKNMSNLDYSEFTYDSDDKAYEAEDYLLTGAVPQLFEEIKVEFKSNVLKKITLSTGNTTSVISFMSNDFTISLPQNILYNEVTAAEWNAATLTTKYALLRTINGSSERCIINKEGSISKADYYDEDGWDYSFYYEVEGDNHYRYTWNGDIDKWEREDCLYPVETQNCQIYIDSLDFDDFTYNSTDKCYESQSITLDPYPYTIESVKVYFENGVLKELIFTTGTTTANFEFLSNDFNLALPQDRVWYEATAAEWNAATNASKYAFSIAVSSTRTQTYYVDGDIMKGVLVDTLEGNMTVYAEKDGEGTCYYRYNESTQTWYADPSSEEFADATFKTFFSAFEYADFEYDESDKCYKAQDITLTPMTNTQLTYNEVQVYFENGKLVKVVYYYDSTDPEQPGVELHATVEFLSTDFTISLPSVS